MNDHFAIVPRSQFEDFFFGKMKIYRENKEINFYDAESIYAYSINYDFCVKVIFPYYIKRT